MPTGCRWNPPMCWAIRSMPRPRWWESSFSCGVGRIYIASRKNSDSAWQLRFSLERKRVKSLEILRDRIDDDAGAFEGDDAEQRLNARWAEYDFGHCFVAHK